MLLIKTITKNSLIHGKGLFADQFIPKDTIIWKYDPSKDEILTEEEYNKLPLDIKEYWSIYSFRFNNLYYLCKDDGIYFNHSSTDFNCLENSVNNTTYAARDIQSGEELTTNYHNFGITKEDHEFNLLGVE